MSLFAQGGTIGLGTLAASGDLLFTPLKRIRTHRRADTAKYRWYNDYELPARLGTRPITVRLHGNADDVQRKFNRTENVRPIPPGDPDFQRLYRRRNDAESINRALDDTLFLPPSALRRARAPAPQPHHLRSDREQPGDPPPRPTDQRSSRPAGRLELRRGAARRLRPAHTRV